MPFMTHWIDRQYFSLAHDGDVARVSGFDDHAQEHWAIIEAGKGYADRRRDALEQIQESIEAGDQPGEVQIEMADK